MEVGKLSLGLWRCVEKNVLWPLRTPLDEVTQIAADVIRAQSLPISVIGVAPSSGGSSYVEILLRVTDRSEAGSRIQLGVFRGAGVEGLRQQIVTQIADQLAFLGLCTFGRPVNLLAIHRRDALCER
jgi:hypothetical protein